RIVFPTQTQVHGDMVGGPPNILGEYRIHPLLHIPNRGANLEFPQGWHTSQERLEPSRPREKGAGVEGEAAPAGGIEEVGRIEGEYVRTKLEGVLAMQIGNRIHQVVTSRSAMYLRPMAAA